MVGLSAAAGRKVSDLSTGMRQRLNLARGLLTEPEVLFLDEPTVGLDVEAARDLRLYIRRWMAERGAGGPGSSLDPEPSCLRPTIWPKRRSSATGWPSSTGAPSWPATPRPGCGGGRSATTRHRIQVEPMPAPDWEKAVPDLRRVAVEGPEELLVELGPGGDISVLVAALAAAGSRVVAIDRVEPTLEDVFVEILDKASDPVDVR